MLLGQGEYWIAAATIWYANGRHAVDTPGYRHQVRSANEDTLTLTLARRARLFQFRRSFRRSWLGGAFEMPRDALHATLINDVKRGETPSLGLDTARHSQHAGMQDR